MPRRPSGKAFRVNRHRQALFDCSPSPPPRGTIVATIDGAARGNPGPAAYGLVFANSAGKVLAQLNGRLPRTTNNVAEYRALVAALSYARAQGWPALKVRTDSELLARQLQGAYRVRSADLKPLHDEARQLSAAFDYFAVEAVPRRLTRPADKLANAALDRRPVPSVQRPVPTPIRLRRGRPATGAQRPSRRASSPVAPLSRAKSRDATGKKKRATGRSLPAGRHGPWPERGRAIRAVYRAGVLKPLKPLDLPDGTEVELTLRRRR
ncbi:MAG: reverse transcriptase-like protein, partial [Terriglobia bacterium]